MLWISFNCEAMPNGATRTVMCEGLLRRLAAHQNLILDVDIAVVGWS